MCGASGSVCGCVSDVYYDPLCVGPPAGYLVLAQCDGVVVVLRCVPSAAGGKRVDGVYELALVGGPVLVQLGDVLEADQGVPGVDSGCLEGRSEVYDGVLHLVYLVEHGAGVVEHDEHVGLPGDVVGGEVEGLDSLPLAYVTDSLPYLEVLGGQVTRASGVRVYGYRDIYLREPAVVHSRHRHPGCR